MQQKQQMKATIIYLTPFVHACKNVPAINSTATDDNFNNLQPIDDSSRNNSCWRHQRETNKRYDLHKNASTRLSKAPQQQQHFQYQEKSLVLHSIADPRELYEHNVSGPSTRFCHCACNISPCKSSISAVALDRFFHDPSAEVDSSKESAMLTTSAAFVNTSANNEEEEYKKKCLQHKNCYCNNYSSSNKSDRNNDKYKSSDRAKLRRYTQLVKPIDKSNRLLETYAAVDEHMLQLPQNQNLSNLSNTSTTTSTTNVRTTTATVMAGPRATSFEEERAIVELPTSTRATAATLITTQQPVTPTQTAKNSQTTTLVVCRCFRVNGDILNDCNEDDYDDDDDVKVKGATAAEVFQEKSEKEMTQLPVIMMAAETAIAAVMNVRRNLNVSKAEENKQNEIVIEAVKAQQHKYEYCKKNIRRYNVEEGTDEEDENNDEVKEAFPSSNSKNRTSRRRQTLPSSLSWLSLPLLLQQELWQQIPLWSQVAQTTFAATSRLLLLMIVMLTLTSTANCWTGRQDVLSNCTFPARWEGSWFLSGYQQSIHIKGSQFSYRGRCAASDGNKYLIVDEKGCHRCLVIYEKHKNVLQYKESECEGDSMYMHQSNPSALAIRSALKQSDQRAGAHPNPNGHSRLSSSDQYIMRSNDDMNDCPPDFCKGRETLQNLCDQIPGDALLYSLFRESAEPVKCPLKGPFVFTYNRGHGECKSPVSNIESCTEESRLLLSFQACPDVQGTESTVEELTCLATWKDGNSRYLVGLVSHHHAISNEERYRCFVYEKISSLMGAPSLINPKDAEYKLAQSGDATCNGLDSAEVGSRIMSLRKPPLAERCIFPAWFKGPRHWHALMGNAVYNYHSNDGSVHIIKPNGYMETRALCEQINKQTPTEVMAVVHYTTGCQSGFMCMMFYRRDTHVIEIQTGKQAARLEDACALDYFDVSKMPFITLLASNPDPQICPLEGLYNLRSAIGPPYLTTRHKRNHNNNLNSSVNKAHNGHGHHRQSENGSSGTNSGNNYAHKRRGTLSFRNTERIEDRSWQANTRGLPLRSRRASEPTLSPNDVKLNNANRKSEVKILPANNTTAVQFASKDLSISDHMRNRREVPVCVTNYKSQRQLQIGCTERNVIDVRPLCTDEGDEEYSCHGSWTENGTVFIIARHKGTKHGVCISYRPTDGTSAKFVIGDACYRGSAKPPEHHLVANLSVFGKCGDTDSSTTQIHITFWLVIMAVAVSTTLPDELLNTR